MSESAKVKPFLKWAGGKQGLVPHLIHLFPAKFGTYYEPFLGGGSVFFSLQPGKAVVSDSNRWLIDTYLALRDDWKEVAMHLDEFENTKESFLQVRKLDPQEFPLHRRAAMLIYLNKTCFRGLFRVNKRGQFNVPYGEYDRRYYSPENLHDVSLALNKIDIRSGDFELGVSGVQRGDFVYLDPPYHMQEGHSGFNRYTSTQYRDNDQVRLTAFCHELDDMGVQWALSNSNTDFVRKLFTDYQFTEMTCRREINLVSKARTTVELLITNYKPKPSIQDELMLFSA